MVETSLPCMHVLTTAPRPSAWWRPPCLACMCSSRRLDPPSQVREAEAEKRKAAAAEGAGQGWRKAAASATAAGKPPNMGMALPGMGGPGADKAMQVCGAAAEGPA